MEEYIHYIIFAWVLYGTVVNLPTILQTSFNKDMQRLFVASPLPSGFKYFLMAIVIVYLVVAWPWVMVERYKRSGRWI